MTTLTAITSQPSMNMQGVVANVEAGVARTTAQQTEPGREVPIVELSVPSRLLSSRETALSLGIRVRETEAVFDQSLRLIADMKAQLTAITKQFPPFAGDDPERFRYLNAFSGLRAQIESLTFPPEPKASGEWAGVEFPAEGMGWDLPLLDPQSASDADVHTALDALEQLGQALGRQRQAFHASMADLVAEPGVAQAHELSLQLRQSLSA